MRVLVTRPEPDATETGKRLLALGHEPVTAPLLKIVFASPPTEIADPAAIVLTSRNGARALSRWPTIAGWLDRPVFVTGRATADAARGAGFADVRSAAGNAADLANLVMSEFGNDVGPILYPAARDHSGALLRGLRANGYDIRTVEAYSAEMVTTLEPAICVEFCCQSIDGVLIYSNWTAVALKTLVEREGITENLRRMAIFALSERAAEPLRDLVPEIQIARKPDENAMLALLSETDR